MSDAPDPHDDHATPIKTPKQLIAVVLAAFVVPIMLIVLLVTYVSTGKKPGAGSEGLEPEAVARRIAPVAKVEWKDASAPRMLRSGEEVYKAVCTACHAAGAAGAPKFGDAAAWAPRIKTGYDALLTSALKGKNAMPAQGGGDYDDVEIGRAVVYMANAAGGKFAEPQAPAAPAAAVAADAAPASAPAVAAAPATAAPAATTPAATAPAAAAAAKVAAATAPAAKAGGGEALYNKFCVACHAAGVAGAPKFGDKAAWAPRLAQGIDTLTQHVIAGKGAMPPRGGSGASDAEIRSAVEYMAAAGK
jgi:cytochrome c5